MTNTPRRRDAGTAPIHPMQRDEARRDAEHKGARGMPPSAGGDRRQGGEFTGRRRGPISDPE